MIEMETINNFKMLPDTVKNADSVKIFTEKEEHDYLVHHGMLNKRGR